MAGCDPTTTTNGVASGFGRGLGIVAVQPIAFFFPPLASLVICELFCTSQPRGQKYTGRSHHTCRLHVFQADAYSNQKAKKKKMVYTMSYVYHFFLISAYFPPPQSPVFLWEFRNPSITAKFVTWPPPALFPLGQGLQIVFKADTTWHTRYTNLDGSTAEHTGTFPSKHAEYWELH